MCGITGIYSHNKQPWKHELFVRWSMDMMRRRGPDSDGFFSDGEVAFGFKRLAIRDISSNANQPMYDQGAACVLVFNGELYNTEYLKSKLPKDIVFRTSSDTEVLFKCLINLGPEVTIPILDGIFAFAFYNKKEQRLVLARDRCGVKPLYYGVKNDLLIFCSEYSHILCHEQFADEGIDLDALGQYLQLGFVPDGKGLFSNTYLLPHGYYLNVLPNQQPTLHQYYAYSWREITSKKQPLLQVISDSVQSQLVSDVPVGVFQSGGIDSSLVSCNAIKLDPTLESFTIGIKDTKEMDESKEAFDFATRIGMKNNVRYIADTNALLELIDQNIDAFSEPFADYSSLPTLMVSKFAREKITVALSGDGGDELFWGYDRNTNTAKLLPYLKGTKARQFTQILKNRLLYNRNVKAPFGILQSSSFIDFAYRRTFITGAKEWCTKLLNIEPSLPFFLKKLHQEIEKEKHKLTDVERMNLLRKIEFDFHLQRVLLKVDRASLYHSLEVRVPLLSNQMLQASQQHNFSECISGNMGKLPLRNALTFCAGNSHSNLPKKGFTIPIDKWIQGVLAKRFTERLQNIPDIFSNIFEQQTITALQKSLNQQHNGWMIWAVFALFEWSDNKLKKQKAEYSNFKLCAPSHL